MRGAQGASLQIIMTVQLQDGLKHGLSEHVGIMESCWCV